MSKPRHEYTLLFRGEHVQTFTTVHEVQAVRLGFRKYHTADQSHLDPDPAGNYASKPEVLRQMKTVAALKRDPENRRKWNTYKGQTFTIVVRPGVTEITEIEHVEA